jgi:hypothetical protein
MGTAVAAQALDAVVGAQATGEHAVAVGHMHHVARPATRGADGAGHDVCPVVDVALGVTHHHRLAGGARRGVQARHLAARHGEQPEGVVVAQIQLGHEGELGEISQGVQIVRMHTLLKALLAVGLDVVVGVAHDHFRRSSWSAEISSRLAVSMGSSSPGWGCLAVMLVSSSCVLFGGAVQAFSASRPAMTSPEMR